MNPFSNMTTDGLEETQDRLGGSYAALDAAIYTGDIKAAYAGQSSGGAHSMTYILIGGDFGDREYRETVYVTNKKGENFYLNPQDKTKKLALPGFTVAEDMCLCTIGTPLAELTFEDKVMNIYNPEQQKEVPTTVKMATGLIGQKVSLAIKNTKEFKTEKDGQGNYVPKADGSTRNVNNIDKVFNTESKLTVAEARGGSKPEDGKFWGSWEERNKGQVIDKTSQNGGQNGKAAGAAPQPGGQAAGGAAPRTSLFGK